MLVLLMCWLASLSTPVGAKTWVWEPIDTLGDSTCRVPIVRGYGSVCAWTGHEVLVWGRATHSRDIADRTPMRNEGARYDPVANRWRPMSTVNAPEPRVGAVGVWTGRELLVCGGLAWIPLPSVAEMRPAIGAGRYDPATDSWRPMSTPGDSSGRVPLLAGGTRAVWTGREMIVWRGSPSDVERAPLAARYDPVADAWRPMSTDGAPPPRDWPELVWTGHELLVSGGEDPSLYASSVHECTSATRLVAWFGDDSAARDFGRAVGEYEHEWWEYAREALAGTVVRDMFRYALDGLGLRRLIEWWMRGPDHVYDPVRDAWSAIPAAPLLDGFWWTPPVWTGTELLLGPPASDSMRSYSPITHRWTSRAVHSSPPPPGIQPGAFVWTGRDALLWGREGNGGGAEVAYTFDPRAGTWTRLTLEGEGP